MILVDLGDDVPAPLSAALEVEGGPDQVGAAIAADIRLLDNVTTEFEVLHLARGEQNRGLIGPTCHTVVALRASRLRQVGQHRAQGENPQAGLGLELVAFVAR